MSTIVRSLSMMGGALAGAAVGVLTAFLFAGGMASVTGGGDSGFAGSVVALVFAGPVILLASIVGGMVLVWRSTRVAPPVVDHALVSGGEPDAPARAPRGPTWRGYSARAWVGGVLAALLAILVLMFVFSLGFGIIGVFVGIVTPELLPLIPVLTVVTSLAGAVVTARAAMRRLARPVARPPVRAG